MSGGRFQPGHDPRRNAGGRPPVTQVVKDALSELTPKAVQRLTELLDSTDEKVVMAATKEILDRNLGKPTQPIEHGGPGGESLRVEILVEPVDPAPALPAHDDAED